jgi:hypothetical protein
MFVTYKKVFNNVNAPLGRLISFDKKFKENLAFSSYFKEVLKHIVVSVTFPIMSVAVRRLTRNCFYSA